MELKAHAEQITRMEKDIAKMTGQVKDMLIQTDKDMGKTISRMRASIQ